MTELDVTELDVTKAETKAMYEEIKAYVLEHTGLKVSYLYIAQIKAKHGVIERDCYNKPKTQGTRVPKCPPEKEKAIEDALRHFRMIPEVWACKGIIWLTDLLCSVCNL